MNLQAQLKKKIIHCFTCKMNPSEPNVDQLTFTVQLVKNHSHHTSYFSKLSAFWSFNSGPIQTHICFQLGESSAHRGKCLLSLKIIISNQLLLRYVTFSKWPYNFT